ncbi:MAG: glycosyltransferase [Cyanobacteria bacterium]|nr:glycosyltransferase [Cyanobacteriota bacterium]MDW8202977.1 glycosyltransferase [Cyanobacteriota bacterium SKYGB_h_bin112]
MNSTPTVSIVMAVYNAERYLGRAIDSILCQTFTDFELIVVNDGSTDGSLGILQAYAQQDDRIRVISREHRGIPATRNELLAQAQGEFIAVMDADDVMLPSRLANQVAFLRQHPDVVCVGGYYDMINGQDKFITHIVVPTEDTDIQDSLLSGRTVIQHSCAMMRHTALREVGGYDHATPLAEDLDLLLRLGERGKLANLAEVILHYRVHPKSTSAQRLRQMTVAVRDVCQRAWQRRGLPPRPCEDAEWRYYEMILRCGWQAVERRDRTEAIAYGRHAVTTLPWRKGSWKLLVVAYLKTALWRPSL